MHATQSHQCHPPAEPKPLLPDFHYQNDNCVSQIFLITSQGDYPFQLLYYLRIESRHQMPTLTGRLQLCCDRQSTNSQILGYVDSSQVGRECFSYVNDCTEIAQLEPVMHHFRQTYCMRRSSYLQRNRASTWRTRVPISFPACLPMARKSRVRDKLPLCFLKKKITRYVPCADSAFASA